MYMLIKETIDRADRPHYDVGLCLCRLMFIATHAQARSCVVVMIRRPPRSTLDRSSAASDVYKRQLRAGSPGPRAASFRATAPQGQCASIRLPAARSFCIDERIAGDNVSRNSICAATRPSGSATPCACARRSVSCIDASIVARRSGSARPTPASSSKAPADVSPRPSRPSRERTRPRSSAAPPRSSPPSSSPGWGALRRRSRPPTSPSPPRTSWRSSTRRSLALRARTSPAPVFPAAPSTPRSAFPARPTNGAG